MSGSPTCHFRASIRKERLNPYVDVPEAVSRAFAPFARAGRIAFEGTLNGVAVRGALVPAGRGRHRLYVNGGMRAAAGVGVGDTVAFDLRAVRPEGIRPPADLAVALGRLRGARAAFDALSTSHRRELIRYLDDARTPGSRARRVRSALDHVLGRRGPPGRRVEARPLWTCPKCGNGFVNRNQIHSCRRLDLSVPFAGKTARIRDLFDRFRRLVESCGPVRLVPYRDRIGFMVQVRFAGAAPRARWLDVGFWLTRRISSPRILKVETISPAAHIHRVRITGPGQIDAELAGWIREAYAVGRREHLGRRGC